MVEGHPGIQRRVLLFHAEAAEEKGDAEEIGNGLRQMR